MSFGRHEEIFSEENKSKGRKRPESSFQPSVGRVSSWLFLGRLLSSRADLRFTNCVPVFIRGLWESRSFQSTVHCLLTVCLTPGGKFIHSLWSLGLCPTLPKLGHCRVMAGMGKSQTIADLERGA